MKSRRVGSLAGARALEPQAAVASLAPGGAAQETIRGRAPHFGPPPPLTDSHPMDTNVTALTDVDYTLDIHVPADEIEPRVTAALKKQRGSMNLKGFRPGKVPLSYVKKMVGPQVAVQVTEEIIAETFREAVSENDAYDVIGQPRLSELDYNFDEGGDLHAVVKFGVRPQFDLAHMEGVPVTKFVRTFTEEDVDAEVEGRRARAATLEPAEDGATIGDTDVAVVDIQPINAEGETTGPKQHGAQIMLADPNLREELKAGLLGKAVGDTFRLELPHQHGEDEGHDHEDHIDRYTVEVTGLSRRILPEIDAEFIKAQTNGEHETLDALKGEIRTQLERSWERRAQQALEAKMVEQFVEAHDFPVPEALIESALDGMVEEIAQRSEGKLPAGFDVEGYREAQREQAEQQVRWLLTKQKLIEDEGIEVTEEDFAAEFEKLAGEDMESGIIRQYFMQQPRLLEQMGDNLLNQRVFAALSNRFEVVEKSRDELERERAAS